MNATLDEAHLSAMSDDKIDQAIGIHHRLQPTSGHTLHQIGVLYSENKGDYHSAINYFRQALKMKEENGDDISDTLTELGFAHQNLGQFDSALTYHLRALTLRESQDKIDHRLIAVNVLGLANVYWGENNLSQALIYAERALVLNRSVMFEKDPRIVPNLAVLANIHHRLGDHIRALEFAKQALIIVEHHTSSDSPSLTTLLNNLGVIQVSAGLYNDAMITFIRLLHLYERVLPKGHHKRIIAETNIRRMTEMQENNIMNLFVQLSDIFTALLLL